MIENEQPRKVSDYLTTVIKKNFLHLQQPPSEWLRFNRRKDYGWDRIRVRQKEGEKTSLENMRERISKETEFFGDYYEKYKEEVEELLVKVR